MKLLDRLLGRKRIKPIAGVIDVTKDPRIHRRCGGHWVRNQWPGIPTYTCSKCGGQGYEV